MASVNANAIVEKLKAWGLRHGEKAVVGLTSALCLLFIGLAWAHPTISMTPDQLKKSAEAAEANINKPQRVEEILAKLDSEKLIDPGFEKRVEDNKPDKVKSDQYVFQGPSWVSPEPGAGLIRDMPELLAPYSLYLSANRGAVLMFAHDKDTGDLVQEDDSAPTIRRKKRRPRPGGMAGGGGMGGGMGGAKKPKRNRKSKAELAAELRKEIEQKNERLKAGLAGEGELEVEKPKDEVAHEKKTKEITKGFRCATILGKLDHKKQIGLYVRALKDPNAMPHYIRLDLERQELLDDDKWGEWKRVDRDTSLEIIANTLEKEEELTADNVRLPGLVDNLPFFKAGYWHDVHLADLVDPSKKLLKAPPKPKKGAGGPGGPPIGGMGGPGMMGGMSGYGDMMAGGGPGAGKGGKMGGMMPGMGGMMGGAMGGRGGGSSGSAGSGPADTDFAKSDAEQLMIRALDFTVEPDATYRYRVRIVVRNPNYGWDTVTPGTDITSEEKEGPWSVATQPVAIPDDVTTYAVKVAPNDPEGKRSRISFQVAKWNEDDGLTIVKTFDAEPGQIIGDRVGAYVPAESGKGTTSRSIDFTSRQLLLDAVGGTRSVEFTGLKGQFEPPAQAIVMRSDGALLLRDQARDDHNPEMKQMKNIYNQSLDEAKAGKKKKSGGAMGGMMGGGMMGGGMMGGGGGSTN